MITLRYKAREGMKNGVSPQESLSAVNFKG